MIKIAFALVTFNFVFYVTDQVFAKETQVEKAQVRGNDTARAVKKSVNRVKESLCGEGQIKCGAKKVGNRLEEATDLTVDSATEVKNKID